LRALAWRQTLGGRGFRAITPRAIGSFLDTVLPGRLGGGVGVLRAASANRWPGLRAEAACSPRI
jgi:hypothetical protein